MPNRNPFSFFCPVLALCGVLLAASCSLDSAAAALGHGSDPNRIRVMSWNAQTFFDDEECGREFEEFRGSDSDWDTESYEIRLDRLRDTILQAGKKLGMGSDRGPDIVALEEIENERVLRDLCNRIPALGAYSHAAFVPSTGEGSFGVGLLSRYPVLSVTAHTPYAASVSVRPIMQAALDTPMGPLVVFVVHWKSKLGETSGPSIRDAQEEILRTCIESLERESPGAAYLACGDFNCGPEESSLLESSPGIWRRYSGEGGSYWYGGAWERIDNILWSEGLETGSAEDEAALGGWRVSRAFPLNDPPLVDSLSHPAAYRVGLKNGYSDHLPLLAELTRDNSL